MVFVADFPRDGSMCDDWCPKINFFTSRNSAELFAHTEGVKGAVIAIDSLVPVARKVSRKFLL